MSVKKYNRLTWLPMLVFITSVLSPLRADAGIIHQQNFATSDFVIGNITAPNGESFSRVSGRDMFGSGEIGQPELPYKVIRFLVPDNAYDFKVTIEDMGPTSPFVLDNAIYPVQKDIPINDYTDDMFTFPDEDMYCSLKTSLRADILEESRLEGRYHIVSVGLWPLVYSGDEKKLELYSSMCINLDYKENTLFKQISKNANPTSFINISDLVVNAEQGLTANTLSSSRGFVNQGIWQKLPRYYIISEKSLIPALEDLATWKMQKGYHVVTTAIEDIYDDERYKVGTNGIVDEAASLRKYLQDEYDEYGTFFCFLVGDHRTRMPIRKAYWRINSKNPSFNGDNYIPTDAYFANLMEDKWDVITSDIGNYSDKDSNLAFDPYIYVGRLLCHSAEEIHNYTSKLILYESNPGRGNTNYLTEAMIFVQYDGKDNYENTLNSMSDLFESVKCLLDSKISSSSAASYPTGEIIINQMNKSGYNSLMGHGEPGTIACSGIYSSDWEYIKALNSYKHDPDSTKSQTNLSKLCHNNGLDLMNNYDSPSVTYTMSCTTMPFDVYIDGWRDIFDLPHTMASSYTVGGPYGGVAYVGNTRSGYWGSSPLLEVLFLQHIQTAPKIGIAEALSKYAYKNWDYIRLIHNLIGDPEFEMWTTRPSNLDVNVAWDQSTISVRGEDAIGSTVVINNGEGNIRLYNITQPVFYPVKYSDAGKMEAVGVYKTGFLPIVNLDCYNDELESCNRRFVVRDAQLGCVESLSVVIGQDANVDIRAVDSVSTGSGLNITSNGKLNLRCDKQVLMEGSEISTGGAISVKGEKVILSNGFSVKAGGTLSINTN